MTVHKNDWCRIRLAYILAAENFQGPWSDRALHIAASRVNLILGVDAPSSSRCCFLATFLAILKLIPETVDEPVLYGFKKRKREILGPKEYVEGHARMMIPQKSRSRGVDAAVLATDQTPEPKYP